MMIEKLNEGYVAGAKLIYETVCSILSACQNICLLSLLLNYCLVHCRVGIQKSSVLMVKCKRTNMVVRSYLSLSLSYTIADDLFASFFVIDWELGALPVSVPMRYRKWERSQFTTFIDTLLQAL